MGRSRTLAALTATGAVVLALLSASAAAASPGSYVLTATNTGPTYAPTFTGNGELGVRVPPAGQGYAGGTVPAQSELAGFYAQPPGDVQKRANTPTWSTLQFTDGGSSFDPADGHTSGWQQSIDLHTGAITTSATWTAPNGHATDLRYEVLTDRARAHTGLTRLTFTPHWSGTATVTDLIDGTPADQTTQLDKGWDDASHLDWVTVQTKGTHINASLASALGTSPNITATASRTAESTDQSVGQTLTFPVTAGRQYVITKYVGVYSSKDAPNQEAAAKNEATTARAAGFDALKAASDAAWAKLWAGRIDVLGNNTLASYVNASEFYLWSSTRAGVNWSVSPAGLSSNGYGGHIFWDAETWMYPSLLAQHPDVAAGMNNYRFDRLAAAIQHALDTGYRGARYPWESALDGTEQIPPPVSVNSEGIFEQHITADIALAQWQYFLATGDRSWLRHRGWPVLSGAATFWASRVTRDAQGRYHILHVTGPDEENPDVNDEAFTNVGARDTLLFAIAAARALGISAPAQWTRIAAGIVVPFNSRLGIHPEFAGYQGQLVKQADVTLLQYPWAFPMPRQVALGDINYYVPRNDPDGPSMSDAVNEIGTSAIGNAGCSSYVYTQRSYEPFIKDVFNQFSETRNGGAFTFMTGIGGFLQEFLYGYSGLRWEGGRVHLDPSLTRQISGVVLHDLRWRGRRFTISVGARSTTVTLASGAPLPISTPAGVRFVTTRHPLRLATRRPDLIPTPDAALCGPASATSAQPGAPALAAADGSPATDWQPASVPATLSGNLHAVFGPRGRSRSLTTASVLWGRQWPPAPAPNVHPPPGPVKTLRASAYTLQLSNDGRSWRTVGSVTGKTQGTLDVFHFRAMRARFFRLAISTSASSAAPMLQEVVLRR
jgi:trehalose/maltose hydrolase-like predicted phosphorylase